MIIAYCDHAYLSMDWTGASHGEAELLPAHHGHLLSSRTCSSESIKLSSSYVNAELQLTVITILKCTPTFILALCVLHVYICIYMCVSIPVKTTSQCQAPFHMFSFTFFFFNFLFWRHILSLIMKLTDSARLSSWQPPRICLSLFTLSPTWHWDYRCVLLCVAFVWALEVKLGSSCL